MLCCFDTCTREVKMAEWRQFQLKQRQKRLAKCEKKGKGELKKTQEEIVVQRMSSEVSGKQQKYTRIGPREFVPFEYDEMSFENIVEPCQKYFAGQIEKDMVCDILAGERGPSCKKISQIPDMKVFYERFIKPEGEEDDDHRSIQPPKKARKVNLSLPSPKKPESKPNQTSKFYPKSLSLKDMLCLGKSRPERKSAIISIYEFDFNNMLWSNFPIKAEFMIEDSPLGSGGLREAFKGTSTTDGFKERTWVIKYLEQALDFIEQTNETEQTHTQKSVQMHSLARNFASQMKDKIIKEQIEGFGQFFEYRKVFMGKMDDGKYVTIEEFIDDDFVKYINNNGKLCESGDVCDKAQAFAHFTYEKSQGKLIVLDIQGAGYTLYDPEIASLDLLGDEGNYEFCTGNLSHIAMNNFFDNHKCNKYCNLLKLKLRPATYM